MPQQKRRREEMISLALSNLVSSRAFSLLAMAFLVLSLTVVGNACQSDSPSSTIPGSAIPTPTPDIQATVEAVVQATIAAVPTNTPPPPPTPSPTSTLAPTPTTSPTVTPLPTATPVAEPTPTPELEAPVLDIPNSPENLPLILLARSNPRLAQQINELPWVADGMRPQESLVVSRLRELAAKEPELTSELVRMPFLAFVADTDDSAAISALAGLASDYPDQLRFLIRQKWFADGLMPKEAVFVSILYTHAVLQEVTHYGPEDFKEIAAQNYGLSAETKEISLPLAGEIKLVSFNGATDHTDAEEVLEEVESMIRAMEKFLDLPFPSRRVLILFTEPPLYGPKEFKLLGLNTGVLIIIRPDLPAPTLKRVLIHELSHYYWHGSGQTGFPPWFAEGAPEFLATRLLKPNPNQAVADRRLALQAPTVFGRDIRGVISVENFGVVACRQRVQVKNIDEINRITAELGYEVSKGYIGSLCHSVYGEMLILSLFVDYGFPIEPFRAALKELYQLYGSADRLVTDEEIYAIFLKHAPDDKIYNVSKLFQEWHGGDEFDLVIPVPRISLDDARFYIEAGISVEGKNLSGLDLSGLELNNLNLARANLSNVDFTDAGLRKANLHLANLTGAILTGADLTLADLSRADLTGVDLEGQSFLGARLEKTQLAGANLSGANLQGVSLRGANLNGAVLIRANMEGADLTKAKFRDANLARSFLEEADLHEADLTDANLTEANLVRADFTRADLTGADLTGADLTRAKLYDVTLEGTIFDGTNFEDSLCDSQVLNSYCSRSYLEARGALIR